MPVFGPSDLAIDIGTATTRVADARNCVSLGPSFAHNIPALQRGVIESPRATTEVLRPLIRKRRRGRLGPLRVLACAPSDVSNLERQMVRSCILEAGATSVIVVPEPLAAAVGAGLDIGSPYAKFIVDFGDGVTDCALIRDGQIMASMAERTGCSDLRRTIQTFAKSAAGLDVTAAESERLLREVGLRRFGTALCQTAVDGIPVQYPLNITDLHAPLRPVLDRMLAPITALLRSLSATLDAEVIEDGIFLTGGGALLPGLRQAVARQSGIDTHIVPDPVGSVIRGARRMLPLAASLNLWKSWIAVDRR